MKISVIVPVYNVENYLEECIESLIKQTLLPFEIILVNDGSTDNSGLICDKYSQEYSFILTVHKKNAGLGMARNTGLDYVSGDYVTFIDSDDFFDKDYIKVMSDTIKKYNCDTCKTSFRRVDLESNFIKNDEIVPGDFIKSDIKNNFIPRIIGSAPDKKDSIPMSSCCTLYSMSIINKNKLRFVSEREWISEDLLFNIEYYMHAKYVRLSEYIGYNYRVNTNSLTTKYNPERFKKCLIMYQKEVELLKQNNLYELCEYRLIRQFFIYLRMCFSQLNIKVCHLSAKDILKEIMIICKNKQVQDMIRQFPVRKMGFKQQVFVYLVKYKIILAIYILFCL
ncbi:glycosyltransferase family 2 protein [Clostridium perfringens]|uniref:glycosyltransferase family 2 protein n=1 Tax=Clostridium perfringens TaxID=1502 RepID=UPI0030D1C0D6